MDLHYQTRATWTQVTRIAIICLFLTTPLLATPTKAALPAPTACGKLAQTLAKTVDIPVERAPETRAATAIAEKIAANSARVTESHLLKYLGSKILNEGLHSANQQMQRIGSQYTTLVKRQIELKWKLLSGLTKWTDIENPVTREKDAQSQDSFYRVNEAAIDSLRQAHPDLAHLQGVSTKGMDFYADPVNKETAEQLLQAYAAGQRRDQKYNRLAQPFEQPTTLEQLVIEERIADLTRLHVQEIKALAASFDNPQFDIKVAEQEIARIVDRFAKALENQFHLDYLNLKRPKDLTGYQQARKKILSQGIFPKAQVQNGQMVMRLPQMSLSMEMDPAIGSPLILAKAGKYPNRQLPMLVMHHGAGTEQSNGSSFTGVIPPIAKSFNPVVYDLPNAGLGLSLQGSRPISDYLNQVANHLNGLQTQQRLKSLPEVDGQPFAPLLAMGRSAGATYMPLLDFYFPNNPYAVKVMSSFSNPLTIKEQLKNLQHEKELGIISHIDQNALDAFELSVSQFMTDIRSASALARRKFELRQLSSIFVLGEADEDGGPNVLKDQIRYSTEFSPLAHNYFLYDPLVDTKYADPQTNGYLGWNTMLEAKHHLYNPRPNVSLNEARQFFPDLPMILWPKPRNQFLEIQALTYGMMDFMISMRAEYQKVWRSYQKREDADSVEISNTLADIIKQIDQVASYRQWLLGPAVAGKDVLFLDWFAQQHNIDPEQVRSMNHKAFFQTQNEKREAYIARNQTYQADDFQVGSAEDYQKSDLTARFARLQTFLFQSESARITQALQNYLP